MYIRLWVRCTLMPSLCVALVGVEMLLVDFVC